LLSICSTSMYHSTDLLTVRGVAHLVVHGTSGSTSYETIPHVQLQISGDVLSTADMVVQRRDGPRRLREIDDDDDAYLLTISSKYQRVGLASASGRARARPGELYKYPARCGGRKRERRGEMIERDSGAARIL